MYFAGPRSAEEEIIGHLLLTPFGKECPDGYLRFPVCYRNNTLYAAKLIQCPVMFGDLAIDLLSDFFGIVAQPVKWHPLVNQ